MSRRTLPNADLVEGGQLLAMFIDPAIGTLCEGHDEDHDHGSSRRRD